jgi:hypothetical protein
VEDRYRYLRLDARVDKVREGGQVVRERRWSHTPCSRPGACEVICLDIGDADTDTFLTAFGLGVVGV